MIRTKTDVKTRFYGPLLSASQARKWARRAEEKMNEARVQGYEGMAKYWEDLAKMLGRDRWRYIAARPTLAQEVFIKLFPDGEPRGGLK